MKTTKTHRTARFDLLGGRADLNAAVAAFVSERRLPGEALDAMAVRLGVKRISEERMAFEGGLFQLAGGETVIKLNAASPRSRRRFTLAHEIGHLLLGTVPAQRSGYHSDPQLERACDAIAAELLMPTEETKAFVKRLGQPSPEKLRSVAQQYSVSLYAAAIRVHSDFQLWNCCIGCWQRRPQVKTAWFVGKRRWSSVEPDTYAMDLALSSDGPVEVEEWWQRGPSPQPVSLKLQRLDSNRVLGLVGFVN